MVVALGPGKFYGSSLPRPRIYTDVKLNEERVDPPVPVLDPFLSWAQEAHWSMGGLSFKRHRLQGRIEGNVKKLRAEREKFFKKAQKGKPSKSGGMTPTPPPALVAVKRKRRMLVDEDEDDENDEEEEERVVKKREIRRTARKLGDDFDRVANEKRRSPLKSGGAAAPAGKKKSPRNEDEISVKSKDKNVSGKKNGEKNGKEIAKGTRTSPRLTKRG